MDQEVLVIRRGVKEMLKMVQAIPLINSNDNNSNNNSNNNNSNSNDSKYCYLISGGIT